MGATSVTGVSGVGSVQDGYSKGSPHMTLGVGHLIGPRVMAAGTCASVTAASTTVDHAPIPGGTASYIVVLTSNNATAPYLTARVPGSFTFTSPVGSTVNWAIITVGSGETSVK